MGVNEAMMQLEQLRETRDKAHAKWIENKDDSKEEGLREALEKAGRAFAAMKREIVAMDPSQAEPDLETSKEGALKALAAREAPVNTKPPRPPITKRRHDELWNEDEAFECSTRVRRVKRKGTGVKKARRTISGYQHQEPTKAEALLARLNIPAQDPSRVTLSAVLEALSAGEVLAALAFAKPQIPAIVELFEEGSDMGLKIVEHLLLYKHTGNEVAYAALRTEVLVLFVSLAVKRGWNREPRERGILTACAVTAIDDICFPARYVGKSARGWAVQIGLPNHQQWQRVWQRRYLDLRYCLQEADNAINALIERHA